MTANVRKRCVLAVVTVATVLCTDGAVNASPTQRPQAEEIAQIASRFVNRLARTLGTLRRVIPVSLRAPIRQHISSAQPVFARRLGTEPLARHLPVSPFQFRLPPPVV